MNVVGKKIKTNIYVFKNVRIPSTAMLLVVLGMLVCVRSK